MPVSRDLTLRHLSGEPSPLFPGDRRVLVRSPVARGASFRCEATAAPGKGGEKVPARLLQMRKILHDSEKRALAGDPEPAPTITLDHVTVNFTRKGGPGGQHVTKVNTKVDMRFNVKNAYWLSETVREKILQMEKTRINKDGEIIISFTRTRTQQFDIQDALGKLQEIIDAASYVPPPPSEETKMKIEKLSAAAEEKRLQKKKVLSRKKAMRSSDWIEDIRE